MSVGDQSIRTRRGPALTAGDPASCRRRSFHAAVAVKVTRAVGTMWCAYAFALLALIGLPSAIESDQPVVVVSWVSQTFLQLVLLSVILVGQNEMAVAEEDRARESHSSAEKLLEEIADLKAHLKAQDELLVLLLPRPAA